MFLQSALKRMALSVLAVLCLTGCTKFEALDATIPAGGYLRHSSIEYGTLPRESLDVYRPKGDVGDAAVVIFFYGGDWQNGYKEGYRFVADALTSKGFVAVLPDYRLYPPVQFPAFVEDGAAAVRWVHDHIADYGGDPSRIFLMGHSAGAHIAALLTLDAHYLQEVGLDRSVIRATAGLSGPYDFIPLSDDLAVFGMSQSNSTPDPKMEPINFVDGKEPPMLLVSGDADPTVDVGNSQRLASKIQAAGGDVKLIVYPHVDHVGVVLSFAWPFRWIAPTLRDVTEYFREKGKMVNGP
jgi:acetyl esterase/lipase